MSNFEVRLRRRDITNDEILDDLRRVAAEASARVVTKQSYDQRGKFGATTVIRKFGSWNSAVRAAGIAVASRQDISDEELFENVATVWTKLGHQPYGRHMSDREIGSHFSITTYEKRFGSWNKALIAFASYISGEAVTLANITTLDTSAENKGLSRRSPRNANWRLRARILIRDSCICQMCGASPAKDPETILHVDHIVPWSRGGDTVEENLRILCDRCNIGRSNVL